MPDYIVRKAIPSDLEGVYAVFSLADKLHRQKHPEIFKKAATPAGIKDYLLASIRAEDAAVIVAKSRGEIIGSIIAWVRQTPENPVLVQHTFLSVENLVVVETFRQQGVGKALMEHIHLWSEELGIKQIQLTVWDFNESAQTFYKQFGYEMLHHRMRKELP